MWDVWHLKCDSYVIFTFMKIKLLTCGLLVEFMNLEEGKVVLLLLSGLAWFRVNWSIVWII